MRRFAQKVCWCWFGRPATPDDRPVDKGIKGFDISDSDAISEGMVDTSDWHCLDIKDLTPDKIDNKYVTKEYTPGEDKKSIEKQLKLLGYDMGDLIGRGSYGRVYIAYGFDSKGFVEKDVGEEVVIKVLTLTVGKYGVRDKRRFDAFKNELFALVKSKHRNIISILDHFIINNECYLVMEFASGGTMAEDVKANGPYNEIVAKDYFGQMSSGIYYLHCCLGFAHLDIKLGNVLICVQKNKTKVIKISDFGLSRLRIDANKGVIKETDPKGTVPYMSPQVLRLYVLNRLDEESIYGKIRPFNPFIADVWSLGVCLYYMLSRELPFSCESDPRLLRDMFTEQKHKKWMNKPKWREVSKRLTIKCKDIVEDMIEPNPNKRLTIQNIVSHVWFEDMFTIEDLTQPKPISRFS